ncbi:kinase-like domain-containing protein [Dendryphion nanum]|uniref:Kinase-like domain-containing protein n=1 Tax=Dendryphion nanum TaxID=256645 RepID=A0A9P9DKN6_9PLEO|nr:kinase-like domain-containing protein [Dendryphion nanum]
MEHDQVKYPDDIPGALSFQQATSQNFAYGSSVPRPESYMEKTFGSRLASSHYPTSRTGVDIGSPASYKTAHTTLSSYATAPGSNSYLAGSGPGTQEMRRRDWIPGSKAGTIELRSSEVFSSDWLKYLLSRGVILPADEELNWSGKGQHVEYDIEQANEIPLTFERVLGHSAMALVESVLCRRIRLARKKIKCHRRLQKKEVIKEVEHLQRVQHRHIIRVVGTYSVRQELSILLYPAAQWNLAEFMDEIYDTDSGPSILQSPTLEVLSNFNRRTLLAHDEYTRNHDELGFWRLWGLRNFLGCLSRAVHFIHEANVKHMDIKPKNILVRKCEVINLLGPCYRVYIADFGIARAYRSAADVETDSPISFTRTYAAPEVVLQDMRGFKADIFSLGCVFLEIIATLLSTRCNNERSALEDARCKGTEDEAFHANIESVQNWLNNLNKHPEDPDDITQPNTIIRSMLNEDPETRPSAHQVASLIQYHCTNCNFGPEPFEAAQKLESA